MGTSKWRTIRPAVGTPGLVELPVTDLERATYFYTTLFPQWVPAEYALGRSRLIETAGDTLIALERHDDDAGLLKPLIYFSAHDLDATLARATAAGGTVAAQIRPAPVPTSEHAMTTLGRHAVGRYAKIRDPDGTLVGLWDLGAGQG